MDNIDCGCTLTPHGARRHNPSTTISPSLCTLRRRLVDLPEMRALLHDISDSDFEGDCLLMTGTRHKIPPTHRRTRWWWPLYYYIAIAHQFLVHQWQWAVNCMEHEPIAWLHSGCEYLVAMTTAASLPAADERHNESLQQPRSQRPQRCDRRQRSVRLLHCVALLPPLFVLAVYCCGVNALSEGIRWTLRGSKRFWFWMLNRICCDDA